MLALPVLAAQPDPSRNLTCAPTPEVKAALAKVPRRDPDCEPAADCWVEKIRAAEALVDKYPFDVHVHRRYQDLVTARDQAAKTSTDSAAKGPLTAAAIERYRRFAAEHPDDPLPHYLLARLNDEPAEAERSLALNPTFPWPHALLATLLRDRGPTGAAGRELEQFARLCPDRFDEVLRRDAKTGDAAMWRRLLPGARAAMLEGPPADQRLWYQTLWDREFEAWPPAEHAAVRRRLRDDLARIERWKRRGDESWWELLQAGYRMLDDPQGLERIESAYASRFPCSWFAVERTIEPFVASRGGWEHLHDQTQAQWRDAFEKTGRWLKACPDQYKYMSYRFEAAARLADTDDHTIVAEADRYLTAWERIADEWTVYPSPYNEVAAEFLSRGIAPQRALDLAHQAQAAFAAERKRRAEWDMTVTDAQKQSDESWDRIVDFDTLGIVAEAALASGRREESEAALAEADALSRGFSAKEKKTLSNSAGCHARYWRVRARLAETARRPPDALAYWRLAVQHADARANVRTITSDKAALDRLWRDLGGTDAGLAAWMSAGREPAAVAQAGGPAVVAQAEPAPAPEPDPESEDGPAWEPRDNALPPFSLTDTTGRTWALPDLSGKTLFINVWATWCGPCKAEIPHLKELDVRLRERTDVLLLSFNTDASPGVVAPFVRANKVTWPVLFAAEYFESLGGEAAVPQNWVVDGSGVRRRLQMGFATGGDGRWLADALAVIDGISDESNRISDESRSHP